MTIPHPPLSDSADGAVPAPGGRGLASAIAVFLGGYLMLASFAGTGITSVAMNLFASIDDRPGVGIPVSYAVLAVLQFGFALVVVVVGLLLGRGAVAGRLVGSALVVIGSLVLFLVLGARLSGMLRFPSGEAGLPFQMFFANPWFSVVLVVGVAWLLGRRARLGWLSLIAVVVLIPLPAMFVLNGIEAGVIQIVMFAVSAIVGAGIIAAGRPWRG